MKRKEKKSSVPFKFSMPKRLLAAFCACVLVPYALGMSFAVHMAQNAIPEAEKTYESRVTALAEQLDTELSRIESQLYYNLRRTPVQYLSRLSIRCAMQAGCWTKRQSIFPASMKKSLPTAAFCH